MDRRGGGARGGQGGGAVGEEGGGVLTEMEANDNTGRMYTDILYLLSSLIAEFVIIRYDKDVGIV